VESYLLKTTFKNTHDDGFYNSSRKDANKISTPNPSTPKSPTKTSKIKCFKCLGFGHITLYCPQKRTLIINEVKQDLTQPPTTSKHEKDKEGQVDMGLILHLQGVFLPYLFITKGSYFTTILVKECQG